MGQKCNFKITVIIIIKVLLLLLLLLLLLFLQTALTGIIGSVHFSEPLAVLSLPNL